MTRTRPIWFAALAAAFLSANALGADPKADEKTEKLVIKFKANKVVLGSDLKSATLTGKVSVSVGDVKIKCKKLVLAYGGGKKVARFKATGKVELQMGDLKATANALDYDAAEKKAVLEGGCRVETKSVDLTGEAITIDLSTRKISIDKAAGTIDIGNQTF